MPFSIKNPEADDLLRRLTELTGESLTDAVIASLRERLVRTERLVGGDKDQRIAAIVDRARRLPVLDERSADEILGYDGHGLPT